MQYLSYRLFPLFLAICIFSSCDPAEQLVITNKTDAEAIVTFVFQAGENPYKFSENSDTLVLKLDASGSPGAVQAYYFGIGTWEIPSSFEELVAAFESIELETGRGVERYQGEAQIRAFLQARIGGPMKAVIELEVE